MKAIGFKKSFKIEENESLIEIEKDMPKAVGLDIVVKVNAVSVNPADAKIRIRTAPDAQLETAKIMGYDAVGIVESIGEEVRNFKIGDRVFYAGDVTRDGSNAQFQAVDSRIVALAPKSLNDAQAAVMPLTSLTGYEALFDRLKVNPHEKKTILIIGGAGGVGSITTQIAKELTNLTVITTASRKETITWCKEMGADVVVNHKDLVNSVKEAGFETVDYIFNVADTKGHWDSMVELIAPFGMIASIVEFEGGVDLSMLQGKAAGFVWELMFTRSLFKMDDIARQGEILTDIANLIDCGRIKTTLTQTINGFSVESLKEAHKRVETSTSIGKLAIDYTK
ncbi:zinc-binding alcohol dehydrogenase family protein [Poseidonibacter lekithochrous]|uniref:zinc-binding alcohol dehydrogenase family protein n=1 Tax=Poseidonibacter TaxID=2321187 RepID=UPI001C09198C|nr:MULTISPECIES: zinc-binding alcohol dehydrogenase family protein [Poseidonibacter]MBU3014992.1 zinc-binding alcohol dehydrogenase family protein [Poseidonibacter lekithochrous]MDO6828289.1 zinc-binding alcohol dehydrogenase family protein [Poseidonibacter sp. 1_MG-2023]